ncbi:MAG TPA: peptidoglycan DD-metalloendopeptidase family protein [Sphingomicrobium sp.]|nr:peptidoglycan DD-metalloendopeptidase family protein [Sphingomicrobium sp.]
MRAMGLALVVSPFLTASALAQSSEQPLEAALHSALAEQAAANAQTARLEQIASRAHSDAERLRAEEAAALEAVDAAEARISAADVQLRLASAYVAAHRVQLAAEQQPISSLLAGLGTMARRPPLLVLADRGGVDELVRVRLLLDSTLPIIRKRTRDISAEIAKGRRLEQAAIEARSELASSRAELLARRQRFAVLEQSAVRQELASTGAALGSSDLAIAAGESVERLRAQETGSLSVRRVAEVLAREQASPASPFKPEGGAPPFTLDYQLPASAPVTEGLGAINDSGVIARGITLATARGTPVAAPADGTIQFAGPFRDYDGVLIIDHGNGWLSLIVNAASTLHPGDRVRRGDEVGRALGPLQVELSRNEHRISAALIAGSSQNLSNGTKGG